MRTLLVLILLANTLAAQDPNTTLPNLGQAIGEGAIDALSDSPKIVVESIPNCDACTWWNHNDAPDLLDVGWTIKSVKLKRPVGDLKYPRWLLCTKDSCTPIENVPRGQFKAALQRALDKMKR